MSSESPFHEGELFVQARAGTLEQSRRLSSVIAPTIKPEAFAFIEAQTHVFLGGKDHQSRIWASPVFGEKGFIRVLDERRLSLDVSAALHVDGPLVWRDFKPGQALGLLCIDLANRRRYRMNVRIAEQSAGHWQLAIEQAYPNCPKYIQRRSMLQRPSQTSPSLPAHQGRELGDAQRALIAKSDTFFVASGHPERGMDVSHRGGQPGFVKIMSDSLLRIPDYIGNGAFNTLGNFVSYPAAGLLFIDFAQNRSLQLSGQARILWDIQEQDDDTGGTRRYWEFEVEAWIEQALGSVLDTQLIEPSPFNP